jgi:hypothetical protein
MPTTLYQSLRAAGLTASEREKREVRMNVDTYVRCGGPFGAFRGVAK